MMKLLLCNLDWLIYVCKEKSNMLLAWCLVSLFMTYHLIIIHFWQYVCLCSFFKSFYGFRHHTVTRGITKGVKEDFRLAMERQVSRCGENLFSVLHRFCINEKIIIIQSLPWHLACDFWTFFFLNSWYLWHSFNAAGLNLWSPTAVSQHRTHLSFLSLSSITKILRKCLPDFQSGSLFSERWRKYWFSWFVCSFLLSWR